MVEEGAAVLAVVSCVVLGLLQEVRVREARDARLRVGSSCEEMSWAGYRHGELAGELEAAARRADRALLGTGVNPGFVMDLLPVVLSSMVLEVRSVRVVRRVDAST